ncbi:hypothetical protein AUEXF2481DRAFT_512211 [Aureobasidium subglaciale EXF-2481]|uniref:Uncharacterized protein n=1 Tax=Aureobasidium subglaciale (strain EXF-2481) TaxID=1043005 RepID=A0A074YAL5_AURSE|nr:uncharacterized protein AUEXF2481DRAFT_512211 [Aureobasidium subglaciale EXF-2481]KEQ91187.1 hypothetical protein AUEXF2481DRAFT_512211 [Aureobasidium subglaciale EXF-2481]
MKYAVVAAALVGAVMAQNSTAGAVPATGCVLKYNTCRTTRVNGLSANQAQCASEYASCLGENPFTEGYSTLPGAPASTAAANGTAAATSGGMVYVTEVVTA